jgi:hypothetical protein
LEHPDSEPFTEHLVTDQRYVQKCVCVSVWVVELKWLQHFRISSTFVIISAFAIKGVVGVKSQFRLDALDFASWRTGDSYKISAVHEFVTPESLYFFQEFGPGGDLKGRFGDRKHSPCQKPKCWGSFHKICPRTRGVGVKVFSDLWQTVTNESQVWQSVTNGWRGCGGEGSKFFSSLWQTQIWQSVTNYQVVHK